MTQTEYNLVDGVKNSDSRGYKHLAIDLVTETYDASTLAKEAIKAGVGCKLGYLADIAAQASEKKRLPEIASKLYNLANELYSCATLTHWHFLDASLPDFAKRILASAPLGELNKKWKVYAGLDSKEVEDWISLYVTQEYAATSRR